MSQDAASLSLQPKQVTATSDENEVSGQVQVCKVFLLLLAPVHNVTRSLTPLVDTRSHLQTMHLYLNLTPHPYIRTLYLNHMSTALLGYGLSIYHVCHYVSSSRYKSVSTTNSNLTL